MFNPEAGPSGSVMASDLWPGIRIQPQMVSRQDLGETETQAQKPGAQRLNLRPVDIPLDIYLVILEHASRETLCTFCLVSKLSYHYAAPLLWRDIELSLDDMRATRFMNALRDIIKRHGKHVETIEFIFSMDERYDEVSWPRPVEAATNTLVEITLENMPKVRSFTWGACQTPSNEVIDALKSRPCLKELRLDSESWNMSLVTELNFSGFRHLTSLVMDNICDDSQVLAIRHILDSSPALKKLRFGFFEYFWEERDPDNSVDVFDILFSKDNPRNAEGPGPGRNLEEFTMIHGLLDEHGFRESFFTVAQSCFKNLDSLTLQNFSPRDTPLVLDWPETLRLRKLRLHSSSWKVFQPLLQDSTKLELLHIEITSTGFDYDELIPLICRSGDTLKDLRLEWRDVRKSCTQETMPKDAARALASKCSKIRQLSLRADFDLDSWCHIETIFPNLFVDLTHFKLQRMTPKEKPSKQPADSNASSSAKNSKDLTTAVKQQLSIDFLTGMNNGIKYPETTAGDLFAVFITAAHGTSASTDSTTKLKYVGIDGHVYELHFLNGMFTFSEVPKEKIVLCGGPFVSIKHKGDYPMDVFRLASVD